MNELFELVENLKKEIFKGKEFAFWNYLNTLEVLLPALKNEKLGLVEENVIIEGTLFLEKGAIVKSGTRIEGNVFVSENSIIGPNAFLRKNVFIGKNCHVANSEIKNSIILNNSNVPHFSYVGDSIIGENVNLGAGTKLANLRFDNKNVIVLINGKKTDSGRRKLGSLIGNNVKTGVNSSINCGKIVGNNSTVFPGTVVDSNINKK